MGRGYVWFLLLIACFFIAKNLLELQIDIDGKHQPQVSLNEVVAILAESSPKEATFASTAILFGCNELASDILFIQTIQHYGDWGLKSEEKIRKIYPLLRALSIVSPPFVPAYSFGALVLKEFGYINEAIDFLNKGIAANPQAFELWLYRDFTIRLFKTQEYKKAIEGIHAALQIEGYPPVLERILAYAYEQDGQTTMAILQWQKVYNSTRDEAIQEICARHIQRLKGED